MDYMKLRRVFLKKILRNGDSGITRKGKLQCVRFVERLKICAFFRERGK